MEFGVLGPLKVRLADRDLAIGSKRQRRLLSVLLIHTGTVLSSERLIAAVWGDDAPATALTSLYTYISRLRGQLHADGDDVLVTRPPGYGLQIGLDQIDAGRFERLLDEARRAAPADPSAALARLDEALAQWRGAAYAEFADLDFARPEATRLAELRRTAVEERFDVGLALGRHADLAGSIDAYAAEHPLRERPRAQLMLALYRCGRQAEALDVFRAFRRRLDDELGVEPSAALRALETAVLRQDPELDWYRPAPVLVPAPEPVLTEGAATPMRPARGLPVEASSLIGRDHDVARVTAALAEFRLVTLTGVGGVGKTRLAVQAATQVAGEFPDGVWWCELAPVVDGADVVHALAAAVGARQQPGLDTEHSVLTALSTKRLLLVVDNCEHVLGDAARLVELILRSCPLVTALATSRVGLKVAGERIQPTAPLQVPGPDAGAAAADSPAVRLFVDRARAVRPDLDLTAENLAHIAELCRQLDGLPLAIELAAVRMRSVNPADLAARISDRFGLLTSAGSTTVERHRTLRAVVDWSYALLSPVEQRLFARLSVFAGGFTLTAAERVCGGDALIDLLASLVDNSLVVAGSTAGRVRYSMLETLRAYGRDLLVSRGELDALRAAHADHYAALAESAGLGLREPDEDGWTAMIDADFDNLRAAHRWATERRDAGLALRLSAGLYHYAVYQFHDEVLSWGETALALPGAETHPLYPVVCGGVGEGLTLRGELRQACALAERALAQIADPDDRTRFPPLKVLSVVALYEGRLDDCFAWAGEALRLARHHRDTWFVAEALMFQGLARTYAGDPAGGLVIATEHLGVATTVGNPSLMAWALYSKAEALAHTDPDQAREHYERVIVLAESVRNTFAVNIAQVGVAALLSRSGDLGDALRVFRHSVRRFHRMRVWHHQWTTLRNLVQLLVRVEANEDAAVLLAALASIADTDAYGADADSLGQAANTLAAALGPAAYAAATARGAGLTADAAVAFALSAIDAIDLTGAG